MSGYRDETETLRAELDRARAELATLKSEPRDVEAIKWTRGIREDTAQVAGLTLCATNLDWWVERTSTGKIIDSGVIMVDGIVAARACAARCAFDVLGITIREAHEEVQS